MKVKELIELLKKQDENLEVIASRDPEGNYFSPVSDRFDFGIYVPESLYYGEIYDELDIYEEDISEVLTLGKAVRALIMFPLN